MNRKEFKMMRKSENNTWKWWLCAMLAFCILFLDTGCRLTVQAGKTKKTVFMPDIAVKSGRYIYYAYETSGIRTGIIRYDVKTGKQKEIVSSLKNKQDTNGFDCLSADSNYIYAEWDLSFGSDRLGPLYIYRFAKDGSKKEKLAKGICPVVCGNYIYYLSYNMMEEWTEPDGSIWRMKKDGSGKEKVLSGKERIYRLCRYGNQILYSDYYGYHSLSGKKRYKETELMFGNIIYANGVTNGNDQYFVNKDKNKLYQKDKSTGKKSVLASFSTKSGQAGSIQRVEKCGDYIVVVYYDPPVFSTSYPYGKIYCISTDGKFKKLLKKWPLGE